MIIKTMHNPNWLRWNYAEVLSVLLLPEDIPFAMAITLNDIFAKDEEAGIRKTTTFIGYLNVLELVNRRLRRDW